MIKRAIIRNYKGLQDAELEFRPDLNILVGDNETGKSTVLEAINLALTGQLNRRAAAYELHPFLFHQQTTADFVRKLRTGGPVKPPEILIEIYLGEDIRFAELKGSNNSRNEAAAGIKLKIVPDDKFAEEYKTYISQPDRVTMVPVEYYRVLWESFAEQQLNLRTTPIKSALIDPGSISNTYAASRYILDTARDYLTPTQQAELALSYRSMREVFQGDPSVAAINERLESESGVITDKRLSVALDMTAKANWETSVLPHLDNLPLTQVGKGEQNAVKIKLALNSNREQHVILIEEPENHLSHTNLNKLLNNIAEHASGRQLIITTHSSFVLNKLGVQHTVLFNGKRGARLSDLPETTEDYFIKLPGHDTLRMVLAQRTILVEGPSDELIVQRAYIQRHNHMPLEDGVEVITVNSLAFRRFLDIARILKLHVAVVTDNDLDPAKVASKYSEYSEEETIRVCYSKDARLPSLEPHLLKVNGRSKLNRILGTNFGDDEALLQYMNGRKTETALKLFKSDEDIEVPDYIAHAIA